MTLAVVVALLVGTLLRISIAVHRDYQVDEVEHVHSAYNVHTGKTIYRDFLETHTPLLYAILQPLVFKDNPALTFLACRLLMCAVSVLILVFTYKIGGVLFSPRIAVVAVLLLTFHTTFAERSIEVRPDPWMTLFFLAAFWLELRAPDRIKESSVSGLLMGISFLFTQKTFFGCLILGVLWVLKAVKKRTAMPVLAPVALFLLPISLSFLYFWHAGAITDYFTRCFWNPSHTLGRMIPIKNGSFSPMPFLLHEGKRNVLFMISASLGLIGLLAAFEPVKKFRAFQATLSDPGSMNQLSWLLAITIWTASLWINPVSYPYYHVAVLPFLALASSWLIVRLGVNIVDKNETGRIVYALVLSGLILWPAFPRILSKTVDTKSYQLKMLREIQSITAEDDSVLDLTGLYFRSDGCWSFFMTGLMLELYRFGFYPPIVPQMISNQTVAVMSNYRTEVLPASELSFIRNHFVHYKGNIFVEGCYLTNATEGSVKECEVLKGRTFRFLGPAHSLEIDGVSFERGPLTEGTHSLKALKPIPKGVLIMDPPGATFPVEPPRPLYVNWD